ncbi:MAG: alpha/beta hydrolase [Lachnospiraceae bacterium]|nr:alpha/beta hydrolase [Lachnospiraceae bacterium]
MVIAIIFILIISIILAGSLFAYFFVFFAPKRVSEKEYVLPQGEQYECRHPNIVKSINEMLSVPYEEVYITSHDGQRLFARYFHVKDNAPTQIQFHGYKSNALIDFCGGCNLARKMEHNALVVDQRSHGKSEGFTISFGIKERRDVLSWIEYCLDRFGSEIPIILCGLSMGAATVLMATDLDLPDNVKGIIADCPYSSPKAIIQKVGKDMHLAPRLTYPFVQLAALLFGHFNLEESAPVTAVSQTDIPILLFHGEDDRFVPCEMSKEIKAACASPITLELIPQAGHGLSYMLEPTRYEAATIRFIQSIL